MPDLVMDDSGPAATSVSPRLLHLRQTCDSMDIKWHWKHKESSLEKLINDREAEEAPVERMTATKVKASIEDVTEALREKRSIPQDVLDALAYCNSYHRANTARIKEYIESIL